MRSRQRQKSVFVILNQTGNYKAESTIRCNADLNELSPFYFTEVRGRCFKVTVRKATHLIAVPFSKLNCVCVSVVA